MSAGAARTGWVLAAIVAGLPAQVVWPEFPVPVAARQAAEADGDLAWAPLSFRIHEHFDLLVSTDAGKRRRGGDYLLALLVAGAERAAAAPERESAVAQAQRIRHLAQGFAGLPFGGDGAEALPAVVWLLRHGPRGPVQDFALAALSRIPCDTTREYFADVLRRGSPIRSAVLRALDLVAAGRLLASVDDLQRWGGYHDARIRERANELLASRGESPAFFDLGESFGPLADDVLHLARELLVERPPPEAPWAVLTPRESAAAGHAAAAREPWYGWLLQEGDAGRPWRLLPATGAVVEVPFAAATVATEPLADHVRRVIAWREQWEATPDPKERVAIEARFGINLLPGRRDEAWPATGAELLLAAWCREAGEAEVLADLLDPLFEAAGDERDVLEPRLHALAAQLDAAMLDAFVRTRDHARALALAERLGDPALASFPGQRRAVELAAQLVQRREDFRTLVLPTPGQWQRMRRDLPRAQQIEFLAARLRLLCGAGSHREGAFDYRRPQPPEPGAASAADPQAGRINPYVELLRLDLARGELPALLPALASRDFLHALTAARPDAGTGGPALLRVADAAAALVDEVAQEHVVDPGSFLAGGEELARARAELVAFSRVRPELRRTARLAERMATAEFWHDVVAAFLALQEVDPVRAGEALAGLTAQWPQQLPAIAGWLALFGRTEFVGEARTWLRDERPAVRFFAACLLLRCGVDPAAPLAEVGRALDGDSGPAWVHLAIEPLLVCQDPGARRILLALLSGERGRYRADPLFVQQLFLGKVPEARERVERALAGEAELFQPPWWGGEPRPLDGAVLRQWLASWWDDGAERQDVPDPAVLRARLAADWAALQSGAPPAMHLPDRTALWRELLAELGGLQRR